MAQEEKKDKSPAASGVEKLIERLKQEGVAAGQKEAERLVEEAQRRADWIINQAREEIEAMQKQAEESMARERAAAEEALRVAARDTVLQMREGVVRRFRMRLHSLVGAQLEDPSFLHQLILEVAGRARQDAGIDTQTRLEVILPRDVVGLSELREHPEKVTQGVLGQYVQAVAGELFREGLAFSVSDAFQDGIRIRLLEKEVEIDLSEQAVSQLLLQHLQPRFRALLEGVIR